MRHLLRLSTAVAMAVLAFSVAAQTAAPAAKSPPPARAKAAAASATAPADADGTSIKKLLEDKFPGATIGNIARSPYAGLYEVQFDDQLVYTDPKVSYVFVGSIFEADSKRNLTEEKLRKLTRIAWDSLPFDLAMKKVKGNGERKLVVFADADCPFCARLENELRNIDNVTIYTFVYPIDQLHPDAARKTRLIWCAPDRQAAWDAWFASKALPDNQGECETPLAKTAELGQKLHINATPTLVFADGSIIPGALPAQRLEAELKQAQSEAAKLAADKASGTNAAGDKPAAKPARGGRTTAVN